MEERVRSSPDVEVIAHAPQGWKNEHLDNVFIKVESDKENPGMSLSEKERRSACLCTIV